MYIKRGIETHGEFSIAGRDVRPPRHVHQETLQIGRTRRGRDVVMGLALFRQIRLLDDLNGDVTFSQNLGHFNVLLHFSLVHPPFLLVLSLCRGWGWMDGRF